MRRVAPELARSTCSIAILFTVPPSPSISISFVAGRRASDLHASLPGYPPLTRWGLVVTFKRSRPHWPLGLGFTVLLTLTGCT